MSRFVGKSVSKTYDIVRPLFSDAVAERISSFISQKIPLSECKCVVDVGSGTGLSTAKLCDSWPKQSTNIKFYGLDNSETQVQQAQETNARIYIQYRVHDITRRLPFESSQVDLITAVQAAHWFDLEPFFKECKRVLKPGGVIAIISYPWVNIEIPSADEKRNKQLNDVVQKVLDELQNTGHYHSRRHRKTIKFSDVVFPFEEELSFRDDPSLFSRKESTVQQFLDLLETSSGVRSYRENVPDGCLLDDFYKEFYNTLPAGFTKESKVIQLFRWYLIMNRKA